MDHRHLTPSSKLKHREECLVRWRAFSRAERDVRRLIARAWRHRRGDPIVDATRALHVSAIFGAYGIHAWALAVNGSPPHGMLIFVESTRTVSVFDSCLKSKKIERYRAYGLEPDGAARVVEDYLRLLAVLR